MTAGSPSTGTGPDSIAFHAEVSVTLPRDSRDMGISLVKRQPAEERAPSAVRVAFYMRVSTAEQELEGYSPEFQKTQLLEHVKRKDYKGWVTRPEWHFFDVGSGS